MTKVQESALRIFTGKESLSIGQIQKELPAVKVAAESIQLFPHERVLHVNANEGSYGALGILLGNQNPAAQVILHDSENRARGGGIAKYSP